MRPELLAGCATPATAADGSDRVARHAIAHAAPQSALI